MGLCYEKGDGVNRDKDEAIYWYQKAAARGIRGATEGIERCKNPIARFADCVDSAFKSFADWWDSDESRGFKEAIIQGFAKGVAGELTKELVK
jgi:hypothetical protein